MEFIREQTKKKPINKKKLRKRIRIALFCGVLLLLLIGLIVRVRERRLESLTDATETQAYDMTEETEAQIVITGDISLTISDYQSLQNALYEIGANVNTSIVTISAESEENDWIEESYEADWQSSGVIVSQDWDAIYILTETRLIEDEANLKIVFVDGATAKAEVINSDENTGMAILSVEKEQMQTETRAAIRIAKLGDSDFVENGAMVIALGSPLGTNYAILSGNITSTDKKLSMMDQNYALLTTDIITSRKGSGILADVNGEVVGVIAQAFAGTEDVGALTVVSVNDIKTLMESLIKGEPKTYIGLYVSTVTEEISEEHGIPQGVFVKEVATESPAMQAGIQSGDVIVRMNDTAIGTDAEFTKLIQSLTPNEKCEIQLLRQSGDTYYDVTCEVDIEIRK